MNKLKIISIIIIALFSLTLLVYLEDSSEQAIKLETSGVLESMNIDDKIEASDLIIVGHVETVLPSRWNTINEVEIEKITSKEIIENGLGVFTDVIIQEEMILKGKIEQNIRVRTFQGKIGHIEFIGESEPLYELGETYILFLRKDNGPTQLVDPGDYIAVNAINGVYKVVDGKAISSDDEWVLEDLIFYIQSSPFSKIETTIDNSLEAQEIIKVIEYSYDIEAKAAYDFNTENFPLVFANSKLFTLNSNKIEFVQSFNKNPSSELIGYLDYKIAYFNWWRESTHLFDMLNQKALSENREVSQEELKEIIDSEWSEKWGLAPARAESPERNIQLEFKSIERLDDTAIVYLHDGFRVVILYLVKVEEQWYIAGDKKNTIYVETFTHESPLVPTEKPIPIETITPTQ